MTDEELLLIPGGELIIQGLSDVKNGLTTEYSLMLQIAAANLNLKGIAVKQEEITMQNLPEHKMYEILLANHSRSEAYSRYSSMMRRLAKFCSCI